MAIEKCLHTFNEINKCENRRTEIVFFFSFARCFHSYLDRIKLSYFDGYEQEE